jgi:DNA-binding IclR family transcriptional regulator
MPESASPTLVLHKAMEVMNCFLPDNEPLALTEIQRATGFPMSTAKRILESLVAEGLVVRRDQRYFLGPYVMVWADAVRRGSDVVQLSEPVLESLRDACGETVTLNVRNGLNRVCIRRVRGKSPINYDPMVGEIIPLQAGSSSKVMLAFDDALAEQVIAQGLTAFTESTIVDPVAFRADLELVRKRGYAIALDETAVGVSSIGAPIFESQGAVAAAIVIGGPSFRCTREWLEGQAGELREAGLRISRFLGWTGMNDREQARSAAS